MDITRISQWASLLLLPYFIVQAVALIKRQWTRTEKTIPSISSASLPRSLLNLKFAVSAVRILESGYEKASTSMQALILILTPSKFKDRAFRIIRADTDLVVLPATLLEELARLPAAIASPHGALEKDLLGSYTGLDIILDSRMHHTVVQRKLTSRLGLLTPHLEAELRSAVDEYFPDCNEWTKFEPYQALAKVAARLSSRALVGEKFCRDPRWLDVAVNYTENLFRTIVLLRLFPKWTHSVIYRFLPSYWRGKQHMQNAKALLSPSLANLLRKNDAGEWAPRDILEDSTVMHWLADSARGGDRNADVLAHIEVLLALASVHTTLLRLINVLYDLIANPEYIVDLQAEILDLHASQAGWPATSYDKMHKLDSVLRESQRISPPTTLGLKRVFKADHTFENGLHVSAGSYVCLPTFAIENDARNTPNPESFDGYRSYRLRQYLETQRAPDDTNKSKNYGEEANFSSFDSVSLNFGYGKHACPGRHFASLMLKMVFVKLLTEYEFEFLPGSSRPSNYMLHEFLFCWPWQKIMVRRRPADSEPKCPF